MTSHLGGIPMKMKSRMIALPLALAMVSLGASVGASQLSGAATSKGPVKVGMILEATGIYSAYETEWREGFNIGLAYASAIGGARAGVICFQKLKAACNDAARPRRAGSAAIKIPNGP